MNCCTGRQPLSLLFLWEAPSTFAPLPSLARSTKRLHVLAILTMPTVLFFAVFTFATCSVSSFQLCLQNLLSVQICIEVTSIGLVRELATEYRRFINYGFVTMVVFECKIQSRNEICTLTDTEFVSFTKEAVSPRVNSSTVPSMENLFQTVAPRNPQDRPEASMQSSLNLSSSSI